MTDSRQQRQRLALQRPPQGATRPLGLKARERRASQQQGDPSAVYDRNQFVRDTSGSIRIRRLGDRLTIMPLTVVGAEVTGKVPTLVEDQGAQGYSMAVNEAVSWTMRRPTELRSNSKPQVAFVLWPVAGDLNSATFTLDVWWRANEEVQGAAASNSTQVKMNLTTQRQMHIETIALDPPEAAYTHMTLRLTCDTVSAPASGEPGLFAAEISFLDRTRHRHES